MRLLLLLAALSAHIFGAACTNTTFSGFTAAQCKGVTLTTTTALSITMDSNITSGNVIAGLAVGNGGTTLSISGTSCQSISFTTSTANTSQVISFAGKAASSGSCTVTVNSTNSVGIVAVAVEISGTNGSLDGIGANHAFNGGGCAGTPCTITDPAITTTVNGDLVISGIADESSNGSTVTANTGTILVAIANAGLQAQVQSTAGSITPSMKYNSNPAFNVGGTTIAIEAGGGASVPANQFPRVQ